VYVPDSQERLYQVFDIVVLNLPAQYDTLKEATMELLLDM
jgi:hypothetical protein